MLRVVKRPEDSAIYSFRQVSIVLETESETAACDRTMFLREQELKNRTRRMTGVRHTNVMPMKNHGLYQPVRLTSSEYQFQHFHESLRYNEVLNLLIIPETIMTTT